MKAVPEGKPRGGAARRLALLIVGMGLLGGLAWRVESSKNEEVLAIPLELNGLVSSRFRIGQPLPPGCVVRLGSETDSMFLTLVPGVRVQADGMAAFALDELSVRKHGAVVEDRRARVNLRRGRLRFAIAMPEDRLIAVTVDTPSGTVLGQPGSAFSIAAGEKSVRVLCAWGGINWQNKNGAGPATVLLAGEFSERGESVFPTESSARKVIDDAAAQEEMAAVLHLGGQLNPLLERTRSEISFSLFQSR